MNFSLVTMVSLLLAVGASSGCAAEDQAERIRAALLHSRQLGAHGLGYGERSLEELSRKLQPADIPGLISLASDRELRTGVQFALASQCEPAIPAVRDAAAGRRMDFLDASDTLRLISGYGKCSAVAHQRARDTMAEIESLRRTDQAQTMASIKREKEEDGRIQKNALTLMQGGAQAQGLSRAEREEVYRRSLKAMGLAEDGPMTPQQKELVGRMYRSMVLGEPGGSSNTASQ
jgi:hypothetical protein